MHTSYPLALWGRCTTCVRWYYVQTRYVDTVTLQCPVCGGDPERLENRARPADIGPGWSDGPLDMPFGQDRLAAEDFASSDRRRAGRRSTVGATLR